MQWWCASTHAVSHDTAGVHIVGVYGIFTDAKRSCDSAGALAALEEEARRFEDVTQRFEDDPSFAGLFDGF